MPEPDAVPGQPAKPTRGAQDPAPPVFPRYVRVLAVAHVLSRPLGFIGFILLTALACYLWVKHRVFDGWVLGLLAADLACPLLSRYGFRRWFEGWGRRHWPAPDIPDERDGEFHDGP